MTSTCSRTTPTTVDISRPTRKSSSISSHRMTSTENDIQEHYNGNNTSRSLSFMDGSIDSVRGPKLHHDDDNEDDLKSNIGQQNIGSIETRNVRRLRIIIGIVLFISATILSITTFRYVQQSEYDTFAMNYQQDANKVIVGIGQQMEQTLTIFDSYTSLIVSMAQQTNQVWPYVTIPNFAVTGSKLRSATEGIQIVLNSVVTASQRLSWENYTSVYGPNWVNETLHMQANDANYYGINRFNYTVDDTIHSDLEATLPYNDTS
jgi:hypothetical protein